MKIGIFADTLNYPLTGVGVYVSNLIENLYRINNGSYEIVLIYKKKNLNIGYDQFVLEGPFSNQISFLWYPYTTKKLKQFDIVHNPNQSPTFFKFNTKNIVTMMDITPILFPECHTVSRTLIFKYLLPNTLNNADAVISISENTKKDLIKYFDVSPNKIVTIPLGVSANFKVIHKEKIQHIKNYYKLYFPFLLHVGTLEPRKNIPSLIKAFYLIKKAGFPHKLILIGKAGWGYSEIFKLIDKLNLKSQVIIKGYIPISDLPAIYNLADLFIYPSQYEGFGLPILEAMACGCPVISSNKSSLPEIIGDGGVICNTSDIENFSNNMQYILTNEYFKNDLISRGLKQSTKFSWENCANETLKLYRKVINV